MSFLATLSRLFGQQPKIYSYETASLYHPDVHQLSNLLINSCWEEFEEEYERLPIGDRHLLMSGFGNLYLDQSALHEWTKTGSYLASLLSGTIKMTSAWVARGASRAHDVDDESFQQFFSLLDEAYDHLTEAHTANPTDTEAAARLIRVMMGSQEHHDIYSPAYEQTQPDVTPHLGAGFYTIDALSGKWYGSSEEILQFARAQTSRSPVFLSLLPLAHIETWFYIETFDQDSTEAGSYFKNQTVRREILQAYQQQCANRPSDYFDIMSRSVWALVLSLMGEDESARIELEYLGPRGSNKPWDYIDGNTINGINSIRRSLNMPLLPD